MVPTFVKLNNAVWHEMFVYFRCLLAGSRKSIVQHEKILMHGACRNEKGAVHQDYGDVGCVPTENI